MQPQVHEELATRESQRIAEQHRLAFHGEAWHGSSLKQILEKIGAVRAAARPLATAHSIWEIVLHISATHELVHRQLCGDPKPLTPDEDWPSVTDTRDAAWHQALDALETGHARVMSALARVPDARLDQPIMPASVSLYCTVHGLVQHDLYHAGQIALLAKVE
jgi:uncharacterized damage-inducible protein DinB